VVEALDLQELCPEGIWISCVSGYLKPDPRAFRTVADEWMFDPSAICVIGDKISTDVFGARLSGMPCVLYNEAATTTMLATRTSVAAVINHLDDVALAIEPMMMSR
jgi:FMN phosphatase YigB (HAD superfamily)